MDIVKGTPAYYTWINVNILPTCNDIEIDEYIHIGTPGYTGQLQGFDDLYVSEFMETMGDKLIIPEN